MNKFRLIKMEDWKWIQGYENLYKICSNGDVISCRFNKEKILKPRITGVGYLYVSLCKNKKTKNFSIHRLIAIHFIDNPEDYECVDHINQNKTDNRIEILRWVTYSANNRNIKSRGKYLKGVYFNKEKNKFQAQICIDYKLKYLGRFDTELEAHEKYMEKHNEIMEKF